MHVKQLQTFLHKICLSFFGVFVVLIISPFALLLIGAFVFKGYYERITTEKIKWAPLYVPLRRRLESFAVGLMVFYGFLLMPTFIYFNLFLLYSLNNTWRLTIVIYWIYDFFDHYTNFSVLNGIGWKTVRTFALGQYARNYFPVELVKTTDLEPDKNYVIACFPHGLMSLGPIINMSYDIRKWLKLFPGIRPKLATLDIHFGTPIIRHCLRFYGFISTSKESLLYYLRKSSDPRHVDNKDGYTSYACGVAIGGAKEASETKPGRYKLIIKNRKGFVKIAIMTGSSIVPSFTFNEVDTFDQIITTPDSLTYRFQSFVKRISGIWPAMTIGRGFFQYTFGLMPQRRRLVQVVGAPIHVEKCEEPDATYINRIHQKVISAVQELFETYKDQYLETYKDAELIIA